MSMIGIRPFSAAICHRGCDTATRQRANKEKESSRAVCLKGLGQHFLVFGRNSADNLKKVKQLRLDITKFCCRD